MLLLHGGITDKYINSETEKSHQVRSTLYTHHFPIIHSEIQWINIPLSGTICIKSFKSV